MGKVGSLSVTESLRPAVSTPAIYHIHHIAGETPEYFRYRLRIFGYRQPRGNYVQLALKEYIEENSIHFPWKVITTIREPIDQMLSAFFHNPELIGTGDAVDELGRFVPEKALLHLQERMHRPGAFDYVNSWFDLEIKGVFDVDLMNSPFDKQRGYTIQESEKASVLAFTFERLNDVFRDAVPSFLGLHTTPPLTHVNSRVTSTAGPAYKWVRERLTLPEQTLRRIYSADTIAHFYDEETIEVWIDKWSSERRKS